MNLATRSPFDPSLPLVMAGGCSGSGLTLLSLLLDSHPQVICGPDLNLLCHPSVWANGLPLTTSLGPVLGLEPLRAPDHLPWLAVDRAKLGWYLTSVQEVRAGLGEFDGPESLMRFIHAGRRVAERKSVAVDASAGNIFSMRRALERSPDLKAIICMRDGRAVIQSRMKARITVKAAAAQWVASAAIANDVLERFGRSRVHVVSLEELLMRPMAALQQLCVFLGVVPSADAMLSRESTLRRGTDPSILPGNARLARWAAKPLEPLNELGANAWRTGVTQRYTQQLAITRLRPEAAIEWGLSTERLDGASLMARWGYALDGKDLSPPALTVKEQAPGSQAIECYFMDKTNAAPGEPGRASNGAAS